MVQPISKNAGASPAAQAPSSAGSPAAASPTGSASASRAWLAFCLCGAIWGSTFLVISLGNDVLAPVWSATLRLALAAPLLAVWALLRGDRWPRGPALRAALAYGICQFGINFPLLYWGEKVVPSGLSAVLYATIPLTSAFMTRAFGMERLSLSKVAGALTAFAGVAVLFSNSFRGHIPASGLLAVFTGATMAGLGTVLLKRGPRQSPIAANAVGCAVGALMSATISFGIGETHAWPSAFRALLPLLYLTVAGSLGAFVVMSWLLNHWSVARTSYVTVIVPVIALGLGTAVRHEPLTLLSMAGTALVLTGLLVGMRGSARSHRGL